MPFEVAGSCLSNEGTKVEAERLCLPRDMGCAWIEKVPWDRTFCRQGHNIAPVGDLDSYRVGKAGLQGSQQFLQLEFFSRPEIYTQHPIRLQMIMTGGKEGVVVNTGCHPCIVKGINKDKVISGCRFPIEEGQTVITEQPYPLIIREMEEAFCQAENVLIIIHPVNVTVPAVMMKKSHERTGTDSHHQNFLREVYKQRQDHVPGIAENKRRREMERHLALQVGRAEVE